MGRTTENPAAHGTPAAPSNPETDTDEPLPERPQLAPNVELSGEMQESGFEKQQWLAQRDGRFIQLTELLYRVAEQADGKRTHEEMAGGVAEAIGRKVSAANVEQLLRKLLPLGLIIKADGSVADAGDGPRSPLSVNMRMAMISPRFIDPFTRFLQYLYTPPILILVLLIAAAAQGWLFFAHGIATATHDALESLGLLLPILGVIIVSTAWHEFGHASALRYGGGKVRGMGAGLYLIYPAFYTDVTDNYRLGRWAKVRTDLGGFYFNLIFAVGLIGVYFLTGAEWLLLVVVLIDVEILHQFLPFVRLDGYWALADLTGLPDFFSLIGPFLRTVLPLPFWQGPRLPALKGWVKAVYALYLIITVPILAFLLFGLIKGVPRVLATGWSSFQRLAGDFGGARGGGDILGMVTSGVQMLLLALPTLGTVYILIKLAKSLAIALWRWGQPSPARRALSSLGGVAIVALLAFLWAPQLPFGRGGDGQALQGPLYAGARAAFVPIAPNERGNVPDLIGGNVVVQPPGGRPVVITPGATVTATATVPATVPGGTTAPAVTPTGAPSAVPTQAPSLTATAAPTQAPSLTATPGANPAIGTTPTVGSAGTVAPTQAVSLTPTAGANPAVGITPTVGGVATAVPTTGAALTPTVLPTAAPGGVPTSVPAVAATATPTVAPTGPAATPAPTPTISVGGTAVPTTGATTSTPPPGSVPTSGPTPVPPVPTPTP